MNKAKWLRENVDVYKYILFTRQNLNAILDQSVLNKICCCCKKRFLRRNMRYSQELSSSELNGFKQMRLSHDDKKIISRISLFNVDEVFLQTEMTYDLHLSTKQTTLQSGK